MKYKILSVMAVFCFGFGVMSAYLFVHANSHTNPYEFCATSTQGEVCLSDLKGKNILIYFGYTFCPDVCPTTLSLLSNALQEHNNPNDFILLFITLDPNRDTPQDAQTYAQSFFPHSYGLWLESKELRTLADTYGVKYQITSLPDSAMEYSIAHSSNVFLFDKDGGLYRMIDNPSFELLSAALTDISSPLIDSKNTDKTHDTQAHDGFLDASTITFGGKPTLLLFGADTCTQCQQLLESLRTDTTLQASLHTRFWAYYIDLSHPHIHTLVSASSQSLSSDPAPTHATKTPTTHEFKTNELAARYNVHATPTAVLLDSDGEMEEIFIGKQSIISRLSK